MPQFTSIFSWSLIRHIYTVRTTREEMEREEQRWASTAGFLAACVGSAVGLGNIWMFPYRAGKYGGGAFLAIYIFLLFIVGVTGLTMEWTLGRSRGGGPIKSFAVMPFGKYLGVLPTVTMFLILSFYSVVFAWILRFFVGSISGEIFRESFLNDIAFQPQSLIFCIIAISITTLIVMAGVKRGIERANLVMMPLLFVLLIILAIKSVTLPGAYRGVEFYLMPDLSEMNATTWLMALSQVFFSLSLAGGTMVVYGSYQSKNRDLTLSSVATSLSDTAVAIIAGLVVIPAVFAFGMEPGEGPELIFVTLPKVFASMRFGWIFAILFFFTLILATLSTAISLLEVCVNALCEHLKWRRKKATFLSALLTMASGSFLSVNENFFEFIVDLSSIYLVILGALMASIALMWFYGSKRARDELNRGGRIKFGRWWEVMGKYVYPAVLIVILLAAALFGIG